MPEKRESMLYKENWEAAKKRLEALWSNEIIDRCCVAIRAPKNNVKNRTGLYIKPAEHEELVKYHTDPEYVLSRNIVEFESTYYGGEALPVLNPTWGDSGYAIYFNSNYKYSQRTTWFFPTIEDWEKDKVVFNEKTAQRHISFVEEIAKNAKGKFLMSAPDYIGGADALINLRGVENTLMDMIDVPEKFLEGLCEIRSAVKKVGSEFFKIINKACEGGSAWAWYDTWAKGSHNLVQCDFSAMISPQMFEELILPDLEENCSLLDCAVYHLDGREQLRHLDMILSVPALKMVQWTNVAGQPSVLEFIPVFKKIQKAGKGLLLFTDMKQAEQLLGELSPEGLYLNAGWAESEDEADRFIKKIEQKSIKKYQQPI